MKFSPEKFGDALLDRQFSRLSQMLETPEHLYVRLENWRAEPARTFDGMLVFTDATAWNPGAGAGYYGYHSGIWNKLG